MLARKQRTTHARRQEPVLLFVRSSNRPRQSPQTWGAAEIQNTQHLCFLFVRISAQESGANQTKSSVISICDARLSIVAILSSPPLSLSLCLSATCNRSYRKNPSQSFAVLTQTTQKKEKGTRPCFLLPQTSKTQR